jgi:hypothetical protein
MLAYRVLRDTAGSDHGSLPAITLDRHSFCIGKYRHAKRMYYGS